jgi:hypothetical protein
MAGLGLLARRGVAGLIALLGRSDILDPEAPDRILSGPGVHDGRVFLLRARTMWEARAIVARTGHGAIDLWARGAAVRYELDEQAEVHVEFGNGLVVMGAARRLGGVMRVTPLRRELAALELVLAPARRPSEGS